MSMQEPALPVFSAELGALILPTGEEVPLPGPFDPIEITLMGNCRYIADAAVFAYDPTSRTGLAWRRHPRPHWQMIWPIKREGFEDWAAQYLQTMASSGDFAK